MLLSCTTKEAANSSNDLHSLRLFSTFPDLPFRLAERHLASPFLTSPSTSPLWIVAPEMGPLFCPQEAQISPRPLRPFSAISAMSLFWAETTSTPDRRAR